MPWPAGLQQKVNQQGFEKAIGSTKIRTEVDVGPAKVRRRYTRGVDNYRVTMNIDRSDIPDFEEFYDIDLNGGVLPFDFENPITGTTQEFRMVDDPRIVNIGGNAFQISMLWEKLP